VKRVYLLKKNTPAGIFLLFQDFNVCILPNQGSHSRCLSHPFSRWKHHQRPLFLFPFRVRFGCIRGWLKSIPFRLDPIPKSIIWLRILSRSTFVSSDRVCVLPSTGTCQTIQSSRKAIPIFAIRNSTAQAPTIGFSYCDRLLHRTETSLQFFPWDIPMDVPDAVCNIEIPIFPIDQLGTVL